MKENLHFEMVETVVVLSEECQSPDAGEEERDAALRMAQNIQQCFTH